MNNVKNAQNIYIYNKDRKLILPICIHKIIMYYDMQSKSIINHSDLK